MKLKMKLTALASMAGGLVLSLCLAMPGLAQIETGILRGNAGSRINVRSQPSTSATAPSYGIPGDRVQILRSSRGTDNYVWHYVEFPQSKTRGWIREDLVTLDSNNPAPQRVTFAPGASSASVSGNVQGYETRDYVLNARGGQRMTVDLSSTSTFMQFSVFSPKGETLYVGTNWSGTLPNTGDYTVRVGLVRAEARRNGAGGFRLGLGIR